MNSMLAWVWSSSRQYGFHAYASPEAGPDFKPPSKDWFPGQTVHADIRGQMARIGVMGCGICRLFWAAEFRSAEATELPVWKRPPVSVANGLCHPNGSWVKSPHQTATRFGEDPDSPG